MSEDFLFYGKNVSISEGVYSPKEDSFLLMKSIPFLSGKMVLDLGCGSGIQAANALFRKAKKVTCVDINKQALADTKKNLVLFGFKDFELVYSDLFEKVRGKFDVIIFNPPYIESEKIVHLGLDGGKKGREVLDRFLSTAKEHLNKGGMIFFVQSSLNGVKKTKKILREQGFMSRIIAKEKLFFEELVVIKAWV